MLKDDQLAATISQALLNVEITLRETEHLVGVLGTDDEAMAYHSVVDRVISQLRNDVLEPIFQDHPTLSRKSLKEQ